MFERIFEFALLTKMYGLAKQIFHEPPHKVDKTFRGLTAFTTEGCCREVLEIDPWELYSSPAVVFYSHVPQTWYGRVDLFGKNVEDVPLDVLTGLSACELFQFGKDPRNVILHVANIEGLNYVCVVPTEESGWCAARADISIPFYRGSVWVRVSNLVLYQYISAVREHIWFVDSEMKNVEDDDDFSDDVTPKYIDSERNGWPYN